MTVKLRLGEGGNDEMLTRTRHAADLPPPHRLADETLWRRWRTLIEQGIVRVQEARQRGFPLYQQAIGELDRILLSDEISAQEADLIVELAAHPGLLAEALAVADSEMS